MTQKFDSFKAALHALCVEHKVTLSASGYDHLQVWDMNEQGGEPIHQDAIEDKTLTAVGDSNDSAAA